jgi:small subunit ribosomal protein S16
MVRIRLRRVGAKHQASYRIVAADKESPRDGRFLEILGHYNPRTEPATVVVNEERLFWWLSHGAQPSDAVVKILRRIGTLERWERYKQGEDLQALLAEAEAAQQGADTRTRRDDLFDARAKKKAAQAEKAAPDEAAETEAAPQAQAVTEEAAVEAETEAEAQPAAEAEASAEAESQAEGPAAEEDEPEPAAAGEPEARAEEKTAAETAEAEAKGEGEGGE